MVRSSAATCAAALLTFTLHFATAGALFSVHEDIFAYPQYEVRFPDSPDSYITEEEADRKMASMSLRDRQQIPTSSSTSSPTSYPTDAASDEDDEEQNDERHAIQEQPHRPRGEDISRPGVDIIYEAMLMNNKRYLCSIPIVQPPPKLNATERRKNKVDEEKELARATVSGTELLKTMEGSCLYFISGWWSYSFCFNDHIKQFHQLPPANGLPTIPPAEDPHAASYILGRAAVPDRDAKPDMPKEGVVMELQANGELKYLVQKLAGGTLCDITGKERRIELQYHCAPNASQDRIGYIKEVTTCCYLMVVHTPRLCSDPAFQPPAESGANTIECLEVMNDERIREFRAEKEKNEKNLKNLLDLVGMEFEKEVKGKLAAAGSGGKMKKKPFVGKPTYKQVVMVQEVDLDAAMLDLPEGVEVIDIEAFARLAADAGVRVGQPRNRQPGGGQAAGAEGAAAAAAEGGAGGADAGAEGHDEL
ncbi:hypothetical protein ABW20_dc0101354 [Dactylellina cionopaga]|nr:hypothetical protein ABW20_dc0101354 [Dactylellina cionopaga]